MSTKKIRVLHIIKSLGRGGAEVLLAETLRLHDREKFEFHYIYFLPWKNQVVESLLSSGGIVTCLAAQNNIQLLLQYGRVRDYIDSQHIDLVHCHLPWAGFLGRLLHQLHGITVIYTEHNRQERYHFLTRWLNKLTFNSQSLAVAVSEDVAESIARNIGPSIPVRTINNGVNVSSFVRDESAAKKVKVTAGIPPDAIVVGTVSVFRKQKRLTEWLEVFASCRDLRLKGIIVGDGPLKDEVFAARDRLGLKDRVFMAGLQKEVRPWLSAMDIFMMTSEFEGMPVALLEAMSSGCAICTTDAGGIKQVIRHGENGLMVALEQWRDLVPHLDDLARDNGLRNRLAAAARQTVVEKYTMSAMIGHLESSYAGHTVTSQSSSKGT